MAPLLTLTMMAATATRTAVLAARMMTAMALRTATVVPTGLAAPTTRTAPVTTVVSAMAAILATVALTTAMPTATFPAYHPPHQPRRRFPSTWSRNLPIMPHAARWQVGAHRLYGRLYSVRSMVMSPSSVWAEHLTGTRSASSDSQT